MYSTLRQQLVEHYATMAMNPGSLDHARWRVRELEKDLSGLWIGIANEVAAKIKELKHEENEST